MASIKIRREIAKHLALRNNLQVAAKEVEEKGRLSLRDVATKYGLDYLILDRKIDIVKRKEEFCKKKRNFDAATKEIIEGNSSFRAVSKNYGIASSSLKVEVKKARTQKNYEYDRKINGAYSFTYLQEKLLLKNLKNWAEKRRESLQNLCSCQLCALKQLLTLAYKFSQQNKIKYPPLWNDFKLATIDWLVDFEMRHSDEISLSFESLGKCLEQIQADE